METEVLAPPAEKKLWTYEMLEKLPETNLPTEIWNGELIVSAAPNPNHQTVVGNLWVKIKAFAKERDLGRAFLSPTDVVISSHRVVQPDVVFVAKANESIIQGRIRGVPDLAVEVISESTWRKDRIEKKELYAQAGVKEYWIVDPEARTVEIFVLTDGSYRLHAKGKEDERAESKLLPGLSVSFLEVEL